MSRRVPSGSDPALVSGRSPKVPGKDWPSSVHPLLLQGVHQSPIYGPFSSRNTRKTNCSPAARRRHETWKRCSKPDRQLQAQQHRSLRPPDEYTASRRRNAPHGIRWPTQALTVRDEDPGDRRSERIIAKRLPLFCLVECQQKRWEQEKIGNECNGDCHSDQQSKCLIGREPRRTKDKKCQCKNQRGA